MIDVDVVVLITKSDPYLKYNVGSIWYILLK